MLQGHGHAHKHQIESPSQKFAHGRTRIAKRHMQEIGLGGIFEQCAHQVRRCAVAGRTVTDLARLGLGLRQQRRHVRDARCPVDHEHIALPGHGTNDGKVALRRETGAGRRLRQQRELSVAGKHEGVAVSLCFGQRLRCNRTGLAPAAGLLYGPAMTAAVQALRRRPLLSIITGSAPSMLTQLIRGDLDLVVAPRPRGLKQTPGLEQQLMYVSHPLIYARAGNRLAHAKTLSAVASADWAVAGSAGTPSNIVEEAFRVRRWKPPRIAVQCADNAMLLKIVAGTDLLGVISHPALVSNTEGLDVVPVHVAEGPPHYEVCLFWYSANMRAWPRGLAPVLDALQAMTSSGSDLSQALPGLAPERPTRRTMTPTLT